MGGFVSLAKKRKGLSCVSSAVLRTKKRVTLGIKVNSCSSRDDLSLSGFTLIEIMIVIAIFFIIGGAIFATLTMGSLSWQSGNVQVGVQQEGRKGVDRMAKELRQSGSATIVGLPANGSPYNSVTFQVPEDTDSDGDVVDSSGNIEWGSQITYSVGGLNNEQLLRSQGAKTDVLANDITSLQFTRQSATPRIVEITLESQNTTTRGHLMGVTLDTQVRLRN